MAGSVYERQLVPSTPAIVHVRRLRNRGMMVKEIAAAAGLQDSTVGSLIRQPGPTVSRGTLLAVMAVPVPERPEIERRSDAWRGNAACLGMDPAMFFPERGDSQTLARAKAVCDGCPVKDDCLEYNLFEKDGVYGGTSDRDRRALRRRRLS